MRVKVEADFQEVWLRCRVTKGRDRDWGLRVWIVTEGSMSERWGFWWVRIHGEFGEWSFNPWLWFGGGWVRVTENNGFFFLSKLLFFVLWEWKWFFVFWWGEWLFVWEMCEKIRGKKVWEKEWVYFYWILIYIDIDIDLFFIKKSNRVGPADSRYIASIILRFSVG
jgi:hypothetical protein